MLKRRNISRRSGQEYAIEIESGEPQGDRPWQEDYKQANKSRQSSRPRARSKIQWLQILPLVVIIGLFWVGVAIAQEEAVPTDPATIAISAEELQNLQDLKVNLDALWTFFAGTLVFFMNAGFALVEAGFCRRKNAVNLLAKNLIVFAVSSIAFWAVGFSFMFSDGNSWIGLNGFFLSGVDNSPATNDAYQGMYGALNWTGIPLQIKFFFQLVFAGTAATIVSGAIAERIKFFAFMLFSFWLVAVIYPIGGHWIWGGGWLLAMGFYDFAGSTVVHSVGGWAALIGASALGARIGRYSEEGVGAMPGHNMGFATLGCLVLWLGWFGFNPGSTMEMDASLVGHIALTTNIAAAFGAIAATVTATARNGKPDLSMIINGVLGGLVAITASCAYVSLASSAIIGVVAGISIVFAVELFDRLEIDDPVGALSVHLVNGIWGTLALGLFSQGDAFGAAGPGLGLFMSSFDPTQLGIQALGVISVGGFTVLASLFGWWAVSMLIDGIRVPPEEEIRGLDIGEHGMEAYSNFASEEDDFDYA
ncbi:ammonium transporter [Thalassoporum mexicanum]|uniref:ammonium transporter n=1 Tax=Thalassoporum mexicanum TaxID=3457544 RepID=UPI0021F81492|nr:ammonium transporter [Pseudanabaena sp. PCC 7367]